MSNEPLAISLKLPEYEPIEMPGNVATSDFKGSEIYFMRVGLRENQEVFIVNEMYIGKFLEEKSDLVKGEVWHLYVD